MKTILNWELNHTDVSIPHYPRVIKYLGYCPLPHYVGLRTLGALVHVHRIHRGLLLRHAAKVIGVDPGALSDWEKDVRSPSNRSTLRLRKFINGA